VAAAGELSQTAATGALAAIPQWVRSALNLTTRIACWARYSHCATDKLKAHSNIRFGSRINNDIAM
jgi:hypothetical protein